MSTDVRAVVNELDANKVVLVSRGFGPEELLKVGEILVETGLVCLEVTMDSPQADRSIRELRRAFAGALLVGAGTILDADDARRAIDAGATYVVSPADVVEMIPLCQEAGVASVVGANTPSEILRATKLGADYVKLFPVRAFGPAYIRDVLGPMPFVKFYVSGGVTAESAPAYFEAGAKLVGIGGEVLDRAEISAGDWGSIAKRASRVAQTILGSRSA